MVALILCLFILGGPVDIFVAPGAEGGTGSRERPLGSITAARDSLPPAGGVITLLGGDYPIDRTITFDADCGRVLLRAASGERVRLIGGVVLRDVPLWRTDDSRVVDVVARESIRSVALPDGFLWTGTSHRGMGVSVRPVGSEVFLDGQPLIPARWPNGQEFARISSVVDPGSVPRKRQPDIPQEERETGPVRGGVFAVECDRLERWAMASEPWALGYWHWDWAEELLPIESVDPDSQTVRLGLPHRYGLKQGAPFFVTNLLEELDAPGEYYLDRHRNVLFLWPPKDQEVLEELLITTMSEPLLRLENARHCVVEGIVFEGTRGPAIVGTDVVGIEIRGCTVRHTGTHGIVLAGTGNRILGNEIVGVGATGISIGGGDRATLAAADNLVAHNHVHRFGRLFRTYQPGILIRGVGQTVVNNELHDAPHSAILLYGNDHRIERNEIYDVLRETGDCGAIYCGRDWTLHGNLIRHNHIHDLRGTDSRYQNGVYLDDMASGIAVVGNLVERCNWGMLLGGGRDLDIRDNLFVDCGLGIAFDARGVGWMADRIADPETSTLHQNLAKMPIDVPPWSERFPSLAEYLTNGFGRPVGSRVVGNTFLNTPFGKVDDREVVEVSGNVEDAAVPADHPGSIESIPVAHIGRGQTIALAVDGRSDYTIVIPDAPRDVEREAALELQRFLQRVTGAELKIVAESVSPPSHRIFVGATRVTRGLDLAVLRQDGFTLRTVGEDLHVVGGSGDGVLYGVYQLLETHLGCRMYAPDALVVPSSPTVRLHPVDDTQVPAVRFRQVNYDLTNDRAYRRWHGLHRIQEEAGRTWNRRWVHSMTDFVPPEVYLDEHPEYFALVGGERRPSQLCLTNPDVLRITIDGIRELIREQPEVRYISVSQEDNYEHCECADAVRVNRREESAMGEVLAFVNQLADAFPDRVISTLAYQYTRRPPKLLRPRDNVSIMLCSIEEDRSRPIAEATESQFLADLKGWAAICDDIFLWDYEVQFANVVSPFPNLRVLQPNVRLFVDHGVRHLFLQGFGRRTEFAELRCYLLAKLAWNADADIEWLLDDFLRGYYGAAAPFLRRYIERMHDALEQSGQPLLIYGGPADAASGYLAPDLIDSYREQFALAEQAVADDPVLSARVRTARLPLLYAELEIAKRRGLDPRGLYRYREDGGVEVRPEIEQLLDSFMRGVEAAGISRLREHSYSPADYRRSFERLFDVSLLEHRAFRADLVADPPASPKYVGGRSTALIDGLPGGDTYRENWVGWEGTDLTARIDLGRPVAVTSVRVDALQDPRAWIFLPTGVNLAVSEDGVTFVEVADLRHGLSDRNPAVHTFAADLSGREVRYLRVEVAATKVCPRWHLGAGRPSWFFLDEIVVR